jgi:hypothetical protein
VEQDGRVTGAMVCHAVTEIISVADSPKAFREIMTGTDAVRKILKNAGVARLYTFVPRAHERSIGKYLRACGFSEIPEDQLAGLFMEV